MPIARSPQVAQHGMAPSGRVGFGRFQWSSQPARVARRVKATSRVVDDMPGRRSEGGGGECASLALGAHPMS